MLDISFHPFPELDTERLSLVRPSRLHTDFFYMLRTSEEVMRYVERPRPKDSAEVHKLIDGMNDLIDRDDGIAWVMISKEDHQPIGTIGFWRMKKEHFRAEVGYLLLPEYWGKGLMSEALKRILDFAFVDLKLHSIEADINPANTASASILERHGFRREGYFRECYFWEGKFLDGAVYCLLAKEWK